jgi:hypothetical protein
LIISLLFFSRILKNWIDIPNHEATDALQLLVNHSRCAIELVTMHRRIFPSLLINMRLKSRSPLRRMPCWLYYMVFKSFYS